MNSEDVNINVEEFKAPKVTKKAGQKRTISVGDDDMQVDEATGIEGSRKTHVPKLKRKKQNADIRKIPVPPHRFVHCRDHFHCSHFNNGLSLFTDILH